MVGVAARAGASGDVRGLIEGGYRTAVLGFMVTLNHLGRIQDRQIPDAIDPLTLLGAVEALR